MAESKAPQLVQLGQEPHAPSGLAKLAKLLDVSLASLRAVGCEHITDQLIIRRCGFPTQHCEAWMTPEFDGARKRIGRLVRSPQGEKRRPRGDKGGLTIPDDFDVRSEQPLLVVEGPSDVAACHTLGLMSVGRPSNNAGAQHLIDLLKDAPKSRSIIIVGELDPKPNGKWPGLEGARSIGRKLASALPHLQITWGMPPDRAKDTRTWLVDQKLNPEEPENCGRAGRAFMEKLAQQLNTIDSCGGAFRLTPASAIEVRRTDWLWKDLLPLGVVSLMYGDPGVGKSTIACYLAACFTRGRSMPGGSLGDPMDVLMVSSEDDPSRVIKPRLIAADADLERVFFIQGPDENAPTTPGLDFSTDIQRIESTLDAHPDIKTMIIDPITSYIGKTNSNDNDEVRKVLDPLNELARSRDVTIIGLHHLGKTREGRSAASAMLGATALVGAARAMVLVAQHPDDHDRVVVVSTKSNYGPTNVGWIFERDEKVVDVVGRVSRLRPNGERWTGDPASLINPNPSNGGDTKIEQAKEFLENQLASGPKTLQELVDSGTHSEKTLRRALKDLGASNQKVKRSGKVVTIWTLPGPTADNLANLPKQGGAGGVGQVADGPGSDNGLSPAGSARRAR